MSLISKWKAKNSSYRFKSWERVLFEGIQICLLIGIILRWGFLIWELNFIYCGIFVLILVVFFFFCCFFFHYVSAKFLLWPSSGDLPWPRIGMLSLVTVSPVITAFHSCCLSHHVFDQVNLWPDWVGIETAIFWQCSPGTVETQRLYPLRHGPRFQILPKPARGLLGQKRGAIDNNYGRQ